MWIVLDINTETDLLVYICSKWRFPKIKGNQNLTNVANLNNMTNSLVSIKSLVIVNCKQ